LNLRIPLARRLTAAGLLCHSLFILGLPAQAHAQTGEDSPSGNARLLTTDSAAAIAHPVLGLQRSALALPGGFSLDTSLYADLLLAPNLGLRWATQAGPHHIAAGARYTHFVGQAVYSNFIEGQEPAIQSFEPSLSGPTFYGAYGLDLGVLSVHGEARYAIYESTYFAVTGAAALHFSKSFAVIGEIGTRLKGGSKLRAAAGVRYGGENLGLALGAAYVDIKDPAFPGGGFSILPVFDLSWTFR
jgi:hypothetical protein